MASSAFPPCFFLCVFTFVGSVLYSLSVSLHESGSQAEQTGRQGIKKAKEERNKERGTKCKKVKKRKENQFYVYFLATWFAIPGDLAYHKCSNTH